MYHVYLDCNIYNIPSQFTETNFCICHIYNQQHLNKYSNRFKNNQCIHANHLLPPITHTVSDTYQQKFAKEGAAVLFKCKYDNNNIDISIYLLPSLYITSFADLNCF